MTRGAAVLATLLLAAAPPASAATRTGDELPATDQYVEGVPTSRGGHPTGAPGERALPLPAPVTRALAKARDGERLTAAATAPELGAPSRQITGLPEAGDPGLLASLLAGGLLVLVGLVATASVLMIGRAADARHAG